MGWVSCARGLQATETVSVISWVPSSRAGRVLQVTWPARRPPGHCGSAPGPRLRPPSHSTKAATSPHRQWIADQCLLGVGWRRRHQPEVERKAAQRQHSVAAHRTVALIVQEQDAQVRVGQLAQHQHSSYMSRCPGFEHEPSPHMVKVLAHVAPLGPAAWGRPPPDTPPAQCAGLAACVHVHHRQRRRLRVMWRRQGTVSGPAIVCLRERTPPPRHALRCEPPAPHAREAGLVGGSGQGLRAETRKRGEGRGLPERSPELPGGGARVRGHFGPDVRAR